MALSERRIQEIVAELITRPGHEKVRSLVYEVLVHGLGIPSTAIDFEVPLPEVHGRLDAILGQVVFEFKRDLRAEREAAEKKLADYLSDRQRATGQRFVGVATDGAEFVPYELRGGHAVALGVYRPEIEAPRELLAWIDTIVSARRVQHPDPEMVKQELGRTSLVHQLARTRLNEIWKNVEADPAVQVKRALWSSLLSMVYGQPVEGDDLFLQHTYLTIVAKTMATSILGVGIPPARDLLAGTAFQEAAIEGAVESDFFDWVLMTPEGEELVDRLARQVSRFSLASVEHDVLKGLYESLIDPAQRHVLGEYYTPDWLAERICQRVITQPLAQRVLDPACGSGTFLFHAVRRFLETAEHVGMPTSDAIRQCTNHVVGIDVHPVAVIIARVTYLLAIGEHRLKNRHSFAIPVYLGDSMQWNTEGFFVERDVVIRVPNGPTLHFPGSVASNPGRFDQVIAHMLRLSEAGLPRSSFEQVMRRTDLAEGPALDTLAQSYESLTDLHREGKNHIWGYVARNLTRPIWMSTSDNQADVLVGNPPWLAFRFMSAEMQIRFEEECKRRGLWSGGSVATHQDLSSYFLARCVELYLRPGGRFAFVLPYAAINRKQFAGFRTGRYEETGRLSRRYAIVSFEEVWALDERVQPLFPVPASVFIGCHSLPDPERGALPRTILEFSGSLPRRDASLSEALPVLRVNEVPWPAEVAPGSHSIYSARFKNGATVFPSVLTRVERVPTGRFGGASLAPVVQSRRTKREKKPWRSVPSLRGQVEAEFLYPLYLGESVAPFRVLDEALAVIPIHPSEPRLLTASDAQAEGYVHLWSWLNEVEQVWADRSNSGLSFYENLDYWGKLVSQFPIAPIRVVYAGSGTLPAAAIVTNNCAVIEHSLYWYPAQSIEEALYLTAILNSDALRNSIERYQARGQWGARHFDKLLVEQPIPPFDGANHLHARLVRMARRAEGVAASVPIADGTYFTRVRTQVRQALQRTGILEEIDALVQTLLGL